MKVAIFHDYFGAIGGAERLVLTLARALNADVITTDFDKNSISNLGFEDVTVISLGPLFQISPFKQIQASWKFFSCNVPGYDFYIFSGNWTHYAAHSHTPNLWYCHTPVRAFYDLKDWVLGRHKNPFLWLIAWSWISIHGWFDQQAVTRVNAIVANSENTRRRIHQFYKRDAFIIYPPISTKKFRYIETGQFWLSVNRLYPEKRIDLQIDVFRKMPEEKLIIVGGHSEKAARDRYLGDLSDLPPNISVLGSVSDEVLADLYGRCKGFICTAMDEDFGMTPLEAMSAGKPVVAVCEGGYCESVEDGITGKLVDADVDSIVKGMEKIARAGFESYRIACRKRAELFDEDVFEAKMREQIEYVTNISKGSKSL